MTFPSSADADRASAQVGPAVVGPAAPADAVVPHQRGTQQPRTRPAYKRLHIAAVVVGVAAIGGALALPSGASAHTVTGTVLLWQDTGGPASGAACTGHGADADVAPGAEVRINDATGRRLATGQLQAGRYDGSACAFTFLVPEVAQAGGYRVAVGDPGRPSAAFTYREMRAQSWSVRVTLPS